MKKLLFVVVIGFLLLSCGKEITNQNSEALRVEAFESAEFKALQSAYDKYVEAEYSVVQVFDVTETEKLTGAELEARKEAYIQKISERMFDAKRKRDAFLSKFPSIGEEMTTQELSDLLRGEKQ